MDTHLVISALGSDRPGIVDTFTRAIATNHCSIEDSRMTVLGGEFAIIMLASGTPENIGSLVDSTPELEKELNLTITTRSTSRRQVEDSRRPYSVEVVSMDHLGIVHELSSFFSKLHINIEELKTGTYAAPHTGTPMFTVHMAVSVPTTIKISELRQDFLAYCDEKNLDASIEPAKQ